MNVSGPFIRRPVGTSLLAIGLLLLGATAYFFLPVAPLPQVDFPTIGVSACLRAWTLQQRRARSRLLSNAVWDRSPG